MLLEIYPAIMGHATAIVESRQEAKHIAVETLTYNKKVMCVFYHRRIELLAVGNQQIQCNSKPQSGVTLI